MNAMSASMHDLEAFTDYCSTFTKTQNCFLNEAPLLLNPKPSPRQFLVEFFYMFSRRIKIAHIQIVLALNGLTEILATTFFLLKIEFTLFERNLLGNFLLVSLLCDETASHCQ